MFRLQDDWDSLELTLRQGELCRDLEHPLIPLKLEGADSLLRLHFPPDETWGFRHDDRDPLEEQALRLGELCRDLEHPLIPLKLEGADSLLRLDIPAAET